MEKISWKRVLKLAIPLSIISMIAVVIIFNLGSKSRLIDGDFVGKTKKEIFKSKYKSVVLERVIDISINEKNYETFFFSDTNVCIGHFQKADTKYFKDIYNKLVKRKGEPLGISKDGENSIDVIRWADGTELSYNKNQGVQVKEFAKNFEEYIKGLN